MPKLRTDQDGKSKTASAVDAAHYPEQHEVAIDRGSDGNQEEIAKVAYQLWVRRGCPAGSPEHDWFEASEMLRAKVNSTNVLKSSSGSLQP